MCVGVAERALAVELIDGAAVVTMTRLAAETCDFHLGVAAESPLIHVEEAVAGIITDFTV